MTNNIACDGTYNCQAEFHLRECKVRQRIIDESRPKVSGLAKTFEEASQRNYLHDLVWRIYENPENVQKAIHALKDILEPTVVNWEEYGDEQR
jgi:hypothetical protein